MVGCKQADKEAEVCFRDQSLGFQHVWQSLTRQSRCLQTLRGFSDDLDFGMVLNRMDSRFLHSPSDGIFSSLMHVTACIVCYTCCCAALLTFLNFASSFVHSVTECDLCATHCSVMAHSLLSMTCHCSLIQVHLHAGVVPDMSPTASMSSHMFPVSSDSAYDQTFSMLQASFLNPNPASSCLNPYFASYDQELLPCAFSKRGFTGQDQRAPSHFIPTGSDAAGLSIVPSNQIQQDRSIQRPGSAASYNVPKEVLHVGDDKPMDREARVARYVFISCCDSFCFCSFFPSTRYSATAVVYCGKQ